MTPMKPRKPRVEIAPAARVIKSGGARELMRREGYEP